ncbi:hypothetical protein CLOM_g24467 [Closterium sp. NIES-68]|nr:hypothetical protein CLOM_g24467 [Closterium sp. NIES-68]
MFKGADGKMVGLKNVLLVPNLAANLISVRRLQKAGMDTSSKGSKTYTARLGKWQQASAPRVKRMVAVITENKVTPRLGAAGAEYFLTIVDVYTRMTWVYVLPKKSDVAETVKTDWLPMVERQQDRLVKAIRTDLGGEFLSKDFSTWLKKQGIRHSLTMPYSPAMNGIAERANRTLTETARGLLIEAGLPNYFWPDAVRHACVAKNRALTHVGEDKWVPYVEWIGWKPKVDMLRVFGCMCMALVPKKLRHNKLDAKATWAVHLGMAQNSKGWLLWDPFTKKFLVSRECKFMENLPYKEWKAENQAKIVLVGTDQIYRNAMRAFKSLQQRRKEGGEGELSPLIG